MSKKLSYTLFTEKYRPEKIDDMILPAEYKKFFKQLVKEGEVPNLLLYSSTPGTGKCLHSDECLDVMVTEDFYNKNKHLFEN